jgi:hypothetical protein
MATLVGKQSDPIRALKALLELEYDALGGYNLAIRKLENKEWKEKMSKFKQDHKRHIKELSGFLDSQGETDLKSPDYIKQYLIKGKIALGNLLGDKPIMLAMQSNEEEMVTAYKNMCDRKDLAQAAQHIVKVGLADETRHTLWIKNIQREQACPLAQ